MKVLYSTIVLVLIFIDTVYPETPYFLEKCNREDPEINECLQYSFNKLAAHLQQGVPELDIYEVEPVVIDEITVAIGSGPDGYRAIFNDIQAYGVGNLSITAVRTDIESLQFQITFEIPKIKVKAQYRSSGVLLLVQASGGGEYWGEYDGVKAKVYYKLTPNPGDNDADTYLSVQKLKMDFSVKNIQMGVTNISKGNAVLEAALNLFINSNAQELLKEMKPALKQKLTIVMKNFLERLLDRLPMELWLE
jgi:hypothetical protein